MESWVIYILLVVAIGCGWWLGRRGLSAHQGAATDVQYYEGLNHLLNDRPELAGSFLIESLEVSPGTLDTHFALAGLLRRRGELEKAVEVHQNILNRPDLDAAVVRDTQLELAQDFLLAGLLDRAEDLLVTLSEDPRARKESLRLLLQIHERERQWQRAISVARYLATGDDGVAYDRRISHYYCELAEQSLEKGQLEEAHSQVSSAVGHDNTNARASLLAGGLYLAQGRYEECARILERIREQDPVHIPSSLSNLREAYTKGDLPLERLQQHLSDSLETVPAISIVLELAKLQRDELGDHGMSRLIANHLKQNPTIHGLTQLIDLHMDNTDGVAKENLSILRSFAEALVADKPAYRCRDCGFDGKKLRWQCPSCHEWGSVRPIFGLEGE
ncbi:MAG: lipopolysaccharide assembly protein LapB [Gammaproteobacteria bacterium]|nr:lipopolysaccharide assembly protein LapB [Gammaproteobacteria bacterium]RPG26127.1 MAG: lipopolysaccharide assembly protein LapB [Gammaproteobacteria bacterium TMED50]